MSNDDGNITEHPAVALKRRIEILEVKVRILEKERDQRTRIDLVMIQKYEEMRDLVSRAMKLLDQYPPKQ